MPGVKAFSFHQNRSLEDKSDMTKSNSNVCRCLFGKPNHDTLRKDLDRELQSDRLRGMNRWNFDFNKNLPVDGRYQWDIVSSDYVPEFYSRPCRPSKVQVRRTDTILRSTSSGSCSGITEDEPLAAPLVDTALCENNLNVSAEESLSGASIRTSAPNSQPENRSTEGNLVQRRIDDYMKRRKKRPASPEASLQSSKSPRTE